MTGFSQETRQTIAVATVLVVGAAVSLVSTEWPDPGGSAPAATALPEGPGGQGAPAAGRITDALQPAPVAEASAGLPDPAAAPGVAPVPSGPVPPAGPEPIAPAFDLIRVEPDGSAIIAGTASPGARVHVQLDGAEVSVTDADAEGNFVALAELGASKQPRIVTLMSEMGAQKLLSPDTAIIQPAAGGAQAGGGVPPAQDAGPTDLPGTGAAPLHPQLVPAAPPVTAPAPEPAPERAPVAAENAPAPGLAGLSARPMSPARIPAPASLPGHPSAPEAPVGAATEPGTDAIAMPGAVPAAPLVQAVAPSVAPDPRAEAVAQLRPDSASLPRTAPPLRVMIASADGITILQDSAGRPEVQQNVTLDTISYDAEGEVQLAGRGAAAGAVRVYLDNRPILTAPITEEGQWRTSLPEVESGVYTLRVDELGQDGAVVSRIETPFQREDVADLAAAAAAAGLATAGEEGADVAAPVRLLTVQPDMTLWGIARETYGRGILYVRVFEANRDKIRDPHWIYPGQVFTLPE